MMHLKKSLASQLPKTLPTVLVRGVSNMENYYTAYVRQVGRELDLPRWKKRVLLHGLQGELEERLSEGLGTGTGLDKVGSPKEIADTLLESVDLEERKRYHAVKLFRFRCIVTALAMLLALSVGTFFYFDMTQVGRAEVTIVENSVPYSSIVDEKP